MLQKKEWSPRRFSFPECLRGASIICQGKPRAHMTRNNVVAGLQSPTGCTIAFHRSPGANGHFSTSTCAAMGDES